MTEQYIITEKELERYESLITPWSLQVQGSNIRSRPLSEALKAERERVLDDVEKGLGVCTMGFFHRKLIESLREES